MNLSEAIEKARLCEGNPPPNESCTCDWVIVPILHSLGYDHFDIVSRGADNQNQFPDYTILKGTSHTWYLEAKAWNVSLADTHSGQALNYANQNGRRWVVLSNGKEWRLYDNDIRGTSAEKLVAMARLSNDEEIEPFLDAISKNSVTSGRLEAQAQGFRLASTLNAQMKDADSDVVKAIAKALRSKGLSVRTGDVVEWFSRRKEALVVVPQRVYDADLTNSNGSVNDVAEVVQPVIGVRREDRSSRNERDAARSRPGSRGRISLASLFDIARREGYQAVAGSKPESLVLPNGVEKSVPNWTYVMAEFIRFLATERRLPHLPWKASQTASRWFLVDSAATETGGKPLFCQVQGLPVYYDTNTSTNQKVGILQSLCRATGVDPSQVFITLRG